MFIKTWEAAIGKELPCEWETRNTKDRYAVAVKKDSQWSDIYRIFRMLKALCLKYLVAVPLHPQIPPKFLHHDFNYGYSSPLSCEKYCSNVCE